MKTFLQKIFDRSRDIAASSHEDFDFVAVGFPKTGNTWVRFMLGRYIQLAHGLDALPLFDPVEMQALRDGGYSGPTGAFTHEPLTWETQTAAELSRRNVIAPYRDKKVIFLARHPLDTIVSHYMNMKYKVQDPYPNHLSDFVRDPVFGLDKLFRFYELWAECHSEIRGFHLVRYEDMKHAPHEELSKILEFLGQTVRESDVGGAVSFASFDNLKALESSGTPVIYQSSGFAVFGPRANDHDNPNAHHVRKGKVGGYRTEFSEEECEYYEAQVKLRMPQFFGYA
jgi:Sulfotransferase domain.